MAKKKTEIKQNTFELIIEKTKYHNIPTNELLKMICSYFDKELPMIKERMIDHIASEIVVGQLFDEIAPSEEKT